MRGRHNITVSMIPDHSPSEAREMKRRLAIILSTWCSLLFFSPRYSLAAGFMWPGAGPYVNEIAHLLFLGAMIVFIYEICYAGLQNFSGFRYLLWAWVLLALWNIDAFLGRWAAWNLCEPIILGEGSSLQLRMHDVHTWVVFLMQINNFILLIPAFYLFYRGIKALTKIPRAEHQ
jgi:hypothetical protein